MPPFDTLPLRPELLEGVAQVGFSEMTPIQARALPPMLAGEDVAGQAMTGSGKTAAFGLALLNRLDTGRHAPQALVLCPTRELATQVAIELRALAARLPNTRVLTLCGGHPLRDQRRGLDGGPHVVVGTPGRVGKHLRTGALDLEQLGVLVLDEADRMLDMGFSDQVMEIVARCPAGRQTLLFSATYPEGIAQLSAQVQRRPRAVSVAARVAPDRLQERVVFCAPDARQELVADLLAAHQPQAALVFCETRSDCEAMARFLGQRGAAALALHGELDQRDRDDVLLRFGNGSATVLVATNLAARGLDITGLPMVIIAELSPDPQDHVHRVGRTGRAGESGLALSVVARPREEARLERIEAFTGRRLPRAEAPPPAGRLDGLAPPNRTLLILAGRRDKLRKGDVLGALVKDAGLPPDAVGQIDLRDRVCAVAVAREHARQAREHLRQGRIKGRRVRARLLP